MHILWIKQKLSQLKDSRDTSQYTNNCSKKVPAKKANNNCSIYHFSPLHLQFHSVYTVTFIHFNTTHLYHSFTHISIPLCALLVNF